MHDSEKSDSTIVAMKPPNKAGLPVAEAVERRAGAKGNADRQSTPRTQSRKRVTQALSRVRQAARHRKKERFTALLHHLNVDTLRTAFLALKRKAAPGVDGVTWQDQSRCAIILAVVRHQRTVLGVAKGVGLFQYRVE